MYPVLFDWFGKPVISWYVLALVGFWAGYFSMSSDLRVRKFQEWEINLLIFGCGVAWFLGAYWGQTLTVGRRGAFELSGFVLYGGLFAIFAYSLGLWFVLGWKKKILIAELWDCGALALAWVFLLGRLGCTLYGCCYGTPSGSWPGYSLNHAHWDTVNRTFPSHLLHIKLHPAPLYEALGLGIAAILVLILRRREARMPGTVFPGVSGWLCWITYAGVRFFVEFIRGDDRGPPFIGLSPSQWISLGLFSLGWIVLSGFKESKTIAKNSVK